MLGEYKKTVNSRWMFPSPVKEDAPIVPSYARRRMQQTLERAQCKRVRSHNQRHTDQSGFQPYQPKHRKRGTGCVYQINDHLWEGKYSPVGADGKRISRNIYAKTREECEDKLAVMIEKVKREIAEQKQKLLQSTHENSIIIENPKRR